MIQYLPLNFYRLENQYSLLNTYARESVLLEKDTLISGGESSYEFAGMEVTSSTSVFNTADFLACFSPVEERSGVRSRFRQCLSSAADMLHCQTQKGHQVQQIHRM